MGDITLKYTFELDNGETRVVPIKDVKENITEAEIIELANSFMEKNAEYKGSKFTSFKKCEKITSSTEIIQE